MGVAHATTSVFITFSMIPFASSSMTQRPNFWQARHPLQKRIFLPTSEIFSTSFPASFAPKKNWSASMSLFEPWRRLVEITITFFILQFFCFTVLLTPITSSKKCSGSKSGFSLKVTSTGSMLLIRS